jgi:uncharacterized protein (TIGR03083 family)
VTHLQALEASADRLRTLVMPLDDTALDQRAYPTEWTIADVLSHLGSGAVIQQRRLDDALAGRSTPDDIGPPVWDEWNAKSPRAKADDGLRADQALVDRIATVTDDEAAAVRIALGPLELDLDAFVALRLNEHAFHTWDIAVALAPTAVIPADAAALVVDNLDLIARFSARPTGDARSITVRTTEPERSFTIELAPDAVTVTAGANATDPDLVLPAEAYARLVYGRLDADHTPPFEGDASALDLLRRVFPGP